MGNGARLETQEGEFMKKHSPNRSNQTPRKRKQQGRAIPSSRPKRKSSPVPHDKNGSIPRCPKCKGFLVLHHTALSPIWEIRCINCGWQPHLGNRTVGVSKEMRTIRNLTTNIFSHPSLRLGLASENKGLEQS